MLGVSSRTLVQEIRKSAVILPEERGYIPVNWSYILVNWGYIA